MSLNSNQQSLHEQALLISKNFKKCETDLIDILQKVEVGRVHCALGFPNLFQYANECLMLSEANSYTYTQIAKKAKEIPALKTEIEKGNLEISKARRILPVITEENHATWIEKAETLTRVELEKEILKENPEVPLKESVRRLTKNRVSLKLSLTDEDFRLLQRLKTLLKSASYEEALSKAVKELIQRKDPLKKAERVMRKKSEAPQSSGEFILGELIPGSKGGVVRIAKRTPIPASIRHQVFLRDQGKCCYRGVDGRVCHSSHFIEIHHIKAVARNGSHSLENLTSLCATHHRYHHDISTPDLMRARNL